MRRTRFLCLLTSVFCVLFVAAPAYADLTGFLGVNPTPVKRPVKGVALGAGLVIVGFEAEYADSSEDTEFGGPELRTFMFNGLLQTPIPIAGVQFYGTLGGGAKINLAGPLRLRLDYRVFNLHGTPRNTPVQRFYAGINFKF